MNLLCAITHTAESTISNYNFNKRVGNKIFPSLRHVACIDGKVCYPQHATTSIYTDMPRKNPLSFKTSCHKTGFYTKENTNL